MDSTMEMDFLMKYPAVVPLNSSNDAFAGYIFINDKPYEISINHNHQLEITSTLQPFASEIKQLKTKNFQHPVQLLNNLTEIIKSSTKSTSAVKDDSNLYRRILQQFYEFTNFYLNIESTHLSSDLSCISASSRDPQRRLHQIKIVVDDGGGKSEGLFKVTEFDLPEVTEGVLLQPDDSLVGLYNKFLVVLEGYQDYFDLMDEIDQGCWVMDPESPKRRDNYRRIALSPKMSILVTFNPNNINEIPNIKFLGPQSEIKALSEMYMSNIMNWSSDSGDVLAEILKLLDIERFPSKPTNGPTAEIVLVNSGECCICFSARLNDKLPEIICPNTSCSQFFHTDCLYQWLCSLNSRKLFSEIFGKCPNCEKSIHCPLPEN